MEYKGFTKEELYHLAITKVVCDWNAEDITSTKAMEKIQTIDVEYLS